MCDGMLHNHLKIKFTRHVGKYVRKCHILKQPTEKIGLATFLGKWYSDKYKHISILFLG